MKVQQYKKVEGKEYTGKAEGVKVRWLITKDDGAPNFTMRVIEMAKGGGQTDFDVHPWEHEVFVIKGEGVVMDEHGNQKKLRPGDFVYVAPNEKHMFKSTGDSPLEFVCLIPNDAGKQKGSGGTSC